MDDIMLDAQCRNLANCITALSGSLVDEEANSGIVKIVTEVHKLIQCFKLLGNAYVHELVKKCREVEAKDAEILVSRERLKAKSEELDRSLQDAAKLKGELEESRKDAARAKEDNAILTTSNESLSRLLLKDREQLEELRNCQSHLKNCLHLIATKQLSAACDIDQELLRTECRGFDEDTTSYLKTIFERSQKPAATSVETQTEQMIANQAINDSSTKERDGNKPKIIEYIDLDSDSDSSNSSQLQKVRSGTWNFQTKRKFQKSS